MPSASIKSHSPPPSYYSANPPDYSSIANERSPLLPTYAKPGPYRDRCYWIKRISLFSLAILLTIGIVLALVEVFAVLDSARKNKPTYQEPPPINCSVAIIGAGPAGLAVAATLAKKIAQSQLNLNLNVTVFEQAGQIGGRLAPTQTEANQARHPFSHNMLSLVGPEEIAGPHLLNSSPVLRSLSRDISTLPKFFEIESRVGIHDGKTLLDALLRPSMKTPWTSWLGQLLKYGASVWRAPNLPDKAINKLRRLSTLHKSPGYPFHTAEALVSALGLSSETSSTGAQMLRTAGISPHYEANIILPETQKRFKQRPEHLTNLALSIALHEADKGSRYAGGHALPILQDLADSSGAEVCLETRVNGIRRLEVAPGKHQWILRLQLAGHEEDWENYKAFDKVILAAPWQPSALFIEFGEGQTSPPSVISYLDDHITFFTSRSSLTLDHLGSSESGPRRLLISSPASQSNMQGIRELAFIKDVVQIKNEEIVTEHLYRTFSNHQLDNATLDHLLGGEGRLTWKYHNYIENAYPLLLPNAPLPTFEWHESFWHTGAIETIGSSLDLSLAAGMNIADLVMVQLRDLCRTEVL